MGTRIWIALWLLASAAAGQDGLPRWDSERFPWPMYGQDPRRTGRSPHDGPRSATPGAARNWSYAAAGGAVINVQPIVTNRGVYFGTWGLLRRDPGQRPDAWEKVDGRYYGLHLVRKGSAREQEIFDPLLPARVPAAYRMAGEKKASVDQFWVGRDNDFLVTFYNGTIEGVPCADPVDGTHYLGRGDGNLYAIDPLSGRVRWAFTTFDPGDPDHPDGGGEIIGGPVVGPGRVVYFATVGLPWPPMGDRPTHETNAVYAVDRHGRLVWRYPAKASRLDNWVMAPPAFSPDGQTLYVGTMGGDLSIPGRLIALDAGRPAAAADEERRRWDIELVHEDRPLRPRVHARWLTVTDGGRIVVGGHALHLGGSSPVVACYEPDGKRAWGWIELQGWPSRKGKTIGGLALDEARGVLYATTTHIGRANAEGGELFALELASGRVLGTSDPAQATAGATGGMTGPTVDRSGWIYAGVRGRHRELLARPVGGRMVAWTFDPVKGFAMKWAFEVEGQIDWSPPAIGAGGGLYFGTSEPFPPARQIQWFRHGEIPDESSPRLHAVFE